MGGLTGEQWNAIISLCSLVTTTLGGVLLGFMAYMSKKADAKIELARIEAANAREEAAATRREAQKRGKRQSRHVKALAAETSKQTAMMTETKQSIATLEKQTNGMQERMLKEAKENALQAGKELGKSEAMAQSNTPQQVVVTNPEPIPVVEVHEEPK